MSAIVVFILFIICLVIAIPVSISLGIVSVLPGAFDASFTASGQFVIRSMLGGIDSFPLLAVPMFVLSGIPVIYSGDEVGQVNDYSYKEDPDKAADSRYLHRGAFNWELAGRILDPDSVQGKLFRRLNRLEEIRSRESVFVADAKARTVETWDTSVLCVERCYKGEKLLALFNFSETGRTAWIHETDGTYIDLVSEEKMAASGVNIPAYGFYYLKKIN